MMSQGFGPEAFSSIFWKETEFPAHQTLKFFHSYFLWCVVSQSLLKKKQLSDFIKFQIGELEMCSSQCILV